MGHKGGIYDHVEKICGFPSNRSIRRYNISNLNDEDGFMRANVKMAHHQSDEKNPKSDRFLFSWHSMVAFDSMHTKGHFEVNHYTTGLVGVA